MAGTTVPDATGWPELPTDEFESVDNCMLCGSHQREKLRPPSGTTFARRFPAGAFAFSKELVRARGMVRCSSCGLVYQRLRPRRELLLKLYSSSMVEIFWPVTRLRLSFGRALRVIRQRSPEHAAIMDVGAHNGDFLRALPESWEKAALEPVAAENRNFPAGTEIYQGWVDDPDLDLPESRFDAVTLFDICEHLADPKAAFAHIRRTLKPGGLLVTETGNAACLPARLLGGSWWYYDYIEHFVVFSPSTIGRLAIEAGFEVLGVRPVRHSWQGVRSTLRSWSEALRFLAATRNADGPDRWQANHQETYGQPPRPHWPDHMLLIARRKARENPCAAG